jgi:hypothetical protein
MLLQTALELQPKLRALVKDKRGSAAGSSFIACWKINFPKVRARRRIEDILFAVNAGCFKTLANVANTPAETATK